MVAWSKRGCDASTKHRRYHHRGGAVEIRRRSGGLIEAMRCLAALTDDGWSIERQARDLYDEFRRFRPLPDETSPRRALMKRVLSSGLPVPKADRIARIIRSGEQ
jgi:hypothetical protein